MSFGVSVGDLNVVFKLIKGTVFVFTAPSTSQYRDILQEVHGLKAVLLEIENLQCAPDQEPALKILQLGARRHNSYVHDLVRRLDKFKALSKGGSAGRLKKLQARLKWNFMMADEIQKIRDKLVLYGVDIRTQQINFLMKQTIRTPSPDLTHTWFQAPAIIEDALGRIWPVPSEYNWDMLRAILSKMFKLGPGASKVAANEYALFPTGDCSRTLSNDDLLLPGRRISMAMIISHFEMTSIDQCPTPNCNTPRSLSFPADEMQCPQCRCRFHFNKSLHFPYPQFETARRHTISGRAKELLFSRMRIVARSTRFERLSFRNVRIFLGTDLLTPLTYGKRCRMLIFSNDWPAEVTPANSINVRENESQYTNFERFVRLMGEQSGAAELLIEMIAKENGSSVPHVISQLDSLQAPDSTS